MKLRNKRTGEIADFAFVRANGSIDDGSLAELEREWEDYEEPKECWYIDWNGEVQHFKNWHFSFDEDIEQCKQIGNYFETKEEAEKAVEKLKAWKRLKDKGFRFSGIRFRDDNYIRWNIAPIKPVTDDEAKEMTDDFHLLFSREGD